ncbi:MAG TPA: hypothetical protein VGW38_29325 [Chloroflexota bacterium]|nr:hypothetical protein [Chloroflexota bacterium]
MTDVKGRRDGPAVPESIDFRVIGKLKANPHHLLLLGDDGGCYDYDAVGGGITPLDPDDSWAVDVMERATLPMRARADRLAS